MGPRSSPMVRSGAIRKNSENLQVLIHQILDFLEGLDAGILAEGVPLLEEFMQEGGTWGGLFQSWGFVKRLGIGWEKATTVFTAFSNLVTICNDIGKELRPE